MNWKLPLSIVVAAAAGIGGWFYLDRDAASPAKKRPGAPEVPVLMAQAELRDVPLTLELTGRTAAFESVTIKARIDGQVQTVAFADGQHVRRGEVLVRLDPGDFDARLRQAEATLARDRAQQAKAQADLDRYTVLKARGFVSDASVADMRTALATSEATQKADQAAADLARLQTGYTTVTAPFDGIVGARLVYPGSAVKANDTALAVVNRVRPLYVGFAVAEKHLPRLGVAVGKGQKALPATVKLPGAAEPLSAEVRFLDNTVDPTTGTIQMKALLANDDERVAPGQFVDVSLPLEVLKQVVTVPAEAVQQGPDGPFLYVVQADGTAQLRKIEVAATQKRTAVIAKGVAAGDTVVVDGQLRLVPGAKVRSADAKPKQ
jgi:multidrug efflux system membrane fusion protein